MARRVRKNSGFSLIELMVAVVIIMISMLAVLTAILKSTTTNLQNDLRNTAIRITNQTSEALLALPLTDTEVSATLDPTGATRIAPAHTRTAGNTTQDLKGLPKTTASIRGVQTTYTITWDVAAPSGNIKQINITVGYTFKNQPLTNTAIFYKHKAI